MTEIAKSFVILQHALLRLQKFYQPLPYVEILLGGGCIDVREWNVYISSGF
jgi:hypothetical protein